MHHRHFIFTIPVVLRQLFLRERRLLGILPRCAFLTVKRCIRAVLGQEQALPGMVAAIQTFGSKVEWNGHIHSLVSDGVFLPGGEFVPLPPYDEEFERLLTETFRRPIAGSTGACSRGKAVEAGEGLVLDELVKADRLSLSFRENLLGWQHGGGISVFGRHLVLNEEPARLLHMARYAVRPPVAKDRIHETGDSRILLSIPPDPKTGDAVLLLDPMEWLRRVTNQIPAPRSHLTRFHGACSNRLRKRYGAEDGEVTVRPVTDDRCLPRSGASWARLLKMVFEVDRLTCVRCGAAMQVIAVITAPALIDRLLNHVRGKAAEHGDIFPKACAQG